LVPGGMIGDRTTVCATIEGRQIVLAHRGQSSGLITNELAADISQRDQIGGVGGRDRSQLTLTFAQIDR